MPIKPLNIGKNVGFIYKINSCRSIKVKIDNMRFFSRPYKPISDVHYKRRENLLNIKDHRVSITNSDDPISHKGYTFKVIPMNKISFIFPLEKLDRRSSFHFHQASLSLCG